MFGIELFGAEKVIARLRAMATETRAAVRRALGKSAAEVDSETKRTIYGGHAAGHLYIGGRIPGRAGGGGDAKKSITHRVHDDYAEVGSNLVYLPPHEFGATIRPTKGPYLWFMVPDETGAETRKTTRSGKVSRDVSVERTGWHLVRAKQVTIPARPFLHPALVAKRTFIRETFSHEVYQVLMP